MFVSDYLRVSCVRRAGAIQVIQRHLTAKSHGRVNNVFDHFSDCDFLAALYNPFGNFKPHLQKLCDGINKMLDEENI